MPIDAAGGPHLTPFTNMGAPHLASEMWACRPNPFIALKPEGRAFARAIEAALLKAWLQSLCRPDRMELAAALALPNV